jgi:hypothetical protein
MSNKFDTIYADTVKSMNQFHITIDDNIRPRKDNLYDIGDNFNRFKNIYCDKVIQNYDLVDDSEIIWGIIDPVNLHAIPLRFRYLNKNTAIVSFCMDYLSIDKWPCLFDKPEKIINYDLVPEGLIADPNVEFDKSNHINIIPQTPIPNKWIPKNLIPSSAIFASGNAVSLGAIMWNKIVETEHDLPLKDLYGGNVFDDIEKNSL